MGVAAVVLAVVLGLGYAGLTPFSKDLPGYRSHDASPGGPVSFSTARSAATAAAARSSGGSWTPVEAFGLVPRSSIFLPWPGSAPPVYPGGGVYANGSVGGSGVTPTPALPIQVCWWQPVGSSNLSGVSIPAAGYAVGTGLAPAWFFLFTDPSGGMLVVTVLDGTASAYASIPGGNCTTTYGLGEYGTIASGVVDSPGASSAANAWGGSAFLANTTGATEILNVRGTLTFPEYAYVGSPPCPSGAGCPVIVQRQNYTIPSSWGIAYFGGPLLNFTAMHGEFSATLYASNGTVEDVSAWLGSVGCPVALGSMVPYCAYYGGAYLGLPAPAPPVMGGATPLLRTA